MAGRLSTLLLLGTIRIPAVCCLSDVSADCQTDEQMTAMNNLQTKQSRTTDNMSEWESEFQKPSFWADPTLQAPLEGGAFSDFFNSRTKGHGIHKWLQYFPAYQRHLGKFIGREVHVVEIGIQSGGSLDMWKSVFGAGAHVYGCDIDPQCKAYEGERTKIFIGDQQNPKFWEEFTRQVPQIDILIDDGGHTPEQQIATLGIMLPRLSRDGVYIMEDVHGENNPTWQRLKLEQLDSPKGQHYAGLGRFVSSAHIYPYLLVLERSGNDGDAMVRQVGMKSPTEQPSETHVFTTRPSESLTPMTVQGVFPWLRWNNEMSMEGHSLSHFMMIMKPRKPNGWLVLRDGLADFAFNASWDARADMFASKVIDDFKLMHEGTCCNPETSDVQNVIESLHIYPHLLIAKLTDGQERLVKAPKHGSLWHPYPPNPGA